MLKLAQDKQQQDSCQHLFLAFHLEVTKIG